MSTARPKLAVFKFASCDGCQLTLLNLEDELLELAERFEFAHFLEASSRLEPGPYDIALVEGSVSTPHDAQRIRRIREQARVLIAIGACATAGGIQALRNVADVEAWKAQVYPEPSWIETLEHSTPISDHVRVDAELAGCPISRDQLLRVLARFLLGTTPDLPGASVCLECKRRGAVCVLVARGAPCLGPITRAGCGALCPRLGRECYGCFGPAVDSHPDPLGRRWVELGLRPREVARRLRGIAGWRPEWRKAAQRFEASDG